MSSPSVALVRPAVAEKDNGGGEGLLNVDDDDRRLNSNDLSQETVSPCSTIDERQPTKISNIPSLVCAFLASATTGGTSYAFGLYAAALKNSLRLTQGQLSSISTAFFVAGLFTWIPGLLSDRYGTKFAMALGGCTGASSLLLYWCVAQKILVIPAEWFVSVLSLLGVVTFLSCGSVTGAVFKIVVATTGPGTNSSVAVGVAKGYVGLGSGLYACIFQALRAPGESDLDFLPMAAFFSVACVALPAVVLLPSKERLVSISYHDDFNSGHVTTLYMALSFMATMIVINSLLSLQPIQNTTGTPHSDIYSSLNTEDVANLHLDNGLFSATTATAPRQPMSYSFGIGLTLIAAWVGPICALQYLPRKGSPETDHITDAGLPTSTDEAKEESDLALATRLPKADPLDGEMKQSDSTATGFQSYQGASSLSQEEMGLLSQRPKSHAPTDTAARSVQPKEPDNLNMMQMLKTSSSWLMLWTTTILVGAGTMETNDMGQMVESLGFEPSVTGASLAIFSVAQAVTRVLTGSLSEAALQQRHIPRPFFLAVASFVGWLAHVVLAFAQSQVTFVIGTALAGASFGMVWPLMVLISAEVFGMESAGQNYMLYDGVSSAAGTFLFTRLIAQHVYESHTASPDASAGGEHWSNNACIGLGCFQATHLIAAGLSLTCIMSSVGMLYTTRHAYTHRSSSTESLRVQDSSGHSE